MIYIGSSFKEHWGLVFDPLVWLQLEHSSTSLGVLRLVNRDFFCRYYLHIVQVLRDKDFGHYLPVKDFDPQIAYRILPRAEGAIKFRLLWLPVKDFK